MSDKNVPRENTISWADILVSWMTRPFPGLRPLCAQHNPLNHLFSTVLWTLPLKKGLPLKTSESHKGRLCSRDTQQHIPTACRVTHCHSPKNKVYTTQQIICVARGRRFGLSFGRETARHLVSQAQSALVNLEINFSLFWATNNKYEYRFANILCNYIFF